MDTRSVLLRIQLILTRALCTFLMPVCSYVSFDVRLSFKPRSFAHSSLCEFCEQSYIHQHLQTEQAKVPESSQVELTFPAVYGRAEKTTTPVQRRSLGESKN